MKSEKRSSSKRHRAVKMSDTSTVEDSERKTQLEEFHFQRRILFGCTISLFIANILWITAISTNRWFIVSGDKGIFVESHRRYFKSSHQGIWRYAIVPQPIGMNVVRNFTTLAAPTNDLPDLKSQLQKENYVQEFAKIELPETIEEIDESFRQLLFAHWVHNNAAFGELKTKIHSFIEKPHVKQTKHLDPSNLAELAVIESLLADVEFNKTSHTRFVVPEALRFALFDGWDEKGINLVRVLNHYAKSLQIDPNIYMKNVKYIFRPPLPAKKVFNGFVYHPWRRCTYTNLFADTDEEVIKADPGIDEDMLDLSRGAASFAIFTIFTMILGFIFTVYTFMNPRYMYKRLAGGVHFISGLTSATVCHLLHMTVTHAREKLKYAFPDGATYTYGYGFYFGILVSMINLFSFIMFMWYSRKRKGSKAATEELGMADEQIQIGR